MPATDRNFKGVNSGLTLPDDKGYVALVGPNNSGKSSVLQCLNQSGARDRDYVSPRRFDVQSYVDVTRQLEREIQNQKDSRKQGAGDWSELPAPNPAQELVALSDVDRDRVVRWHNEYFGQLSIESSRPDNKFSPPEITVDGKPLTQQGSGSRAVLSLLTRLFDPAVRVLLIDEPEIGLEPQTQRQLYRLLLRVSKGEHEVQAKQVIVATHSHLFLNREDPTANFVVARDAAGTVSVAPIASREGLNSLVFRLLGNSPSDLFFPKNVVVVEGPSDALFFGRLLQLRGQPDIVVHYADGDSLISAAIPAINQMLKTTAYLPLYRGRICVVVDKLRCERKRLEEWRRYLKSDERVAELSQSGIERYYPPDVLAEVTGLATGEQNDALAAYLEAIRKGEQSPALGTFRGGKVALAGAVADLLTNDHLKTLSDEVLSIIDLAIAHSDWQEPEAPITVAG